MSLVTADIPPRSSPRKRKVLFPTVSNRIFWRRFLLTTLATNQKFWCSNCITLTLGVWKIIWELFFTFLLLVFHFDQKNLMSKYYHRKPFPTLGKRPWSCAIYKFYFGRKFRWGKLKLHPNCLISNKRWQESPSTPD